MGYRGQRKSSYGSQHISGRTVAGIQNNRSLNAKLVDASLKAPIAKTEEQWMNAPNRYDLPDVDTPKVKMSTEAKTELPKMESKVRPLGTEWEIKGQVHVAHPEGIKWYVQHWKEKGYLVAIRKNEGISAYQVYVKPLPKKEEPTPKGSVEDSTATYNKATGWISLAFNGPPPIEIREEMKRNGFRYKPFSKRWTAKAYPFREDLAKKYAGKIEEINIEPNWAAKAEHAAEMAAKHENKSNEIFNQAEKMASVIPFGQPILVGHHSERSDRNFRDRIHNKFGKSFEEHDIAEKYAERAARFGAKATGEDPGVIYRRITKLEAEKRKMERGLAESKSEANKQHYKKWIDHYNTRLEIDREKYKASGGIPTDSIKLQEGMRVKTKYGMGTVKTVSKKTLRVALDPMENGRPKWIYANTKGESLLTKDDIIGTS